MDASDQVPDDPASRQAHEALERHLKTLDSLMQQAAADWPHVRDRLLATARQLAADWREYGSPAMEEVRKAILELVRRHPGPGVVVALAIGFALGRLTRR